MTRQVKMNSLRRPPRNVPVLWFGAPIVTAGVLLVASALMVMSNTEAAI